MQENTRAKIINQNRINKELTKAVFNKVNDREKKTIIASMK